MVNLPKKAISIRQPWADMIMFHGKDIENRTWKTNFRGEVCVHASKKWTSKEKADAEWLIEQLDFQDWGEPDLGAVIGTVEIVDCVQKSDSWWFNGPWGWVLKNPKPLEFAIPCAGRLGFFTPDLSAAKLIGCNHG